jgi:hypothetical protein
VLVYAIPALAILLGLAGIGFAALRWRSGRTRRGRPAAAGADESRLDADLERYDL